MRLGWIVAEPSADLASTRNRCYYPAMALAEHGIASTVFSRSDQARRHLNHLDAIVFLQRLDSGSIRLATEARARGKRVYVDLCDNVVGANYETGKLSQQVPWLVALSAVADSIVTTNAALTANLRAVFSTSANFCEIPNQIETRESLERVQEFADCLRRRAPSLALRILRGSIRWASSPSYSLMQRAETLCRNAARNLAQAPSLLRRLFDARGYLKRANLSGYPTAETKKRKADKKTILWFGDCGSPDSDLGMLSLLPVAGSLESVARDFDVELLVVSNNRLMFENCISPLLLPTRYVEWKSHEIFDALSEATVALLPGEADAFSTTHSASRASLALYHGVPVISSEIASLRRLAQSVTFDNWEDGLRRFLDNKEARRAAVEAARPVIETLYEPNVIAAAWLGLLDRQRPTRRIGLEDCGRRPTAAIVMDLVQDVDVLLPVVDELRRGDRFNLRVILTDAVTRNSRRAIRALIEREINPRYVDHQSLKRGENRMLESVDCLLTSSESTLPAHHASHTISLLARRLGVRTFTLQHGLENAGLTYFDHVLGADTTFASDHVLTWASPSALPASVLPETRSKCVAVGRTAKVTTSAIARLPEWGDKTIIGVFENLHWHRYSAAYRAAFAADIVALAKSRDDLVVLVKSHHTGQFLARERSLLADAPTNVFVLDPRLPCWEPYNAAAILPHCACVITTPSTVALDAAELEIPVAVAAYALEIPTYAPLPALRDSIQWQRFVEEALSNDRYAVAGLQEFRDRVRVPGNAAERTVDFMWSVIPQKGNVVSDCT